MADLERLEKALRNAHAAGDTGAARKIAGAIRELQKPKPEYEKGSYAANLLDSVTFPDMETARAYMQRQQGGQTAQPAQPAGFDMAQFRRDQMAQNIGVGKSAALGAMQGATFGASDEGMGLVNGVLSAATNWNEGRGSVMDPDPGFFRRMRNRFNEGYQERRDVAREALDVARKKHPVAAYGGEVAGGIATGVGAARAGVTAMRGAQTLPRMIKGGAIDGLGYGALAGAGHAEGGLSDRAEGAIYGARTGAAMGAGASVLLSGGSALGRLVKDKVAANIGSPAKQAKARLAQTMRQAGMTPDEIAAKLADLGPEGMLVDTLGGPGAALARSASNMNPAARETLENASTSRMAGQPDRLTDALLDASGLDRPKTLQELQEAARASARPAISEAYNSARSLGHDIDLKAFNDLMQSDIAAKAYSEGQRLAKDRMIAEASRAGTVGDDVLKNGPSNFDILDETKKSLDARAAPALGQPQTNEQAIAGQFSKTIRNRIDEYMPEYGGARDLARQLHQQQDAMILGAEGAKPRVAADFTRRAQTVDPAHQADLAQGYAAAKIDQINNRRTTPGVVDAIFGPRRQQEALSSALGSNATGVRKQIAAERTFGHTDRALRGNSTTARQLAEMGATSGVGAGLGFAAGGDLQSTGLGVLAGLLARRGGAATVRALTAKKEAQVAPMIAEILAGREIPQEMMQQIKRNPALQQLLVRALAQQAGGATGQAVTAP
jgi:hypothetical protein